MSVVRCSPPEPHMKLYKDITAIFKEAYNAIVTSDGKGPVRYISRIGPSYLMITREGDEIGGEFFPNFIRLCTAITLKPRRNINYSVCDCDDSILCLFGKILPTHERNNITIFYELKGDYSFAYLMNENGNIFVYAKPKLQPKSSLFLRSMRFHVPQ